MNQTVEQKLYKISEVEKITGATRKALQEYDKMDLIHPTTKTEGGEEDTTQSQRQQVESIRYRDSNERFRGISDAFSSLSEVF